MKEIKLVNLAAKVYNAALTHAKVKLAAKERKNVNKLESARKKQDRLYDLSIFVVNHANKKFKAASNAHRMKQIELDAAIETLSEQKKLWSI